MKTPTKTYLYITDEDDFLLAPTVLEFNLSNLRQCINVTIFDDNQREINEQFMLNLTLLSINDSNFILSEASVTIIENDSKCHLLSYTLQQSHIIRMYV